MKTKVCQICKKRKKVTEYYLGKNGTLRFCCKQCHSDRAKIYYQSNKNIIRTKQKKYYKNNTEECLKRNINWKNNNLEKYNKSIMNWRKNNIEKRKLQSKNYYQNNKTKIVKRHKRYKKLKYKNDLNYRILDILRSRLNSAIRRKGKKHNSAIKLVGCSINTLQKHLEKQFKDGMNWNNYGFYGWHIDHIIPCSSFDLTNIEQQKICFHYTNLQPLWAKDNLSKGNR